jgi:hypothetical protein
MRASPDEFIATWKKCGGVPKRVSEALGIEISNVFARRARLAEKGVILPTLSVTNNARGTNGFGHSDWKVEAPRYPQRLEASLEDGYAVIFSDSHFWPDRRSLALETLLEVIKEVKPKIVISNGDAFDGAKISRHPPTGWEDPPEVNDELAATKEYMDEIYRAAPKARHLFTVGNHDSRFDRYLAANAGQFKGVQGFTLRAHLPAWEFCYAVMVNRDVAPFYVVHNIRGGPTAPRNNVLAAGCTVFTGHLHSQKSIPVTTLLDELDGVDSGMLADRDGPQFHYVSSRPTDWREGFAVQRCGKRGFRYPPDLARVMYAKDLRRSFFRGEIVCERAL